MKFPRSAIIAAVVLPALTVPAESRASHTEPLKAKAITFSLVNGYFECGSPNTATQTGGMPACEPPNPSNLGSGCALLPIGSGKLALKVIGKSGDGTQDLQIAVAVNGLNQFCNFLDVVLSYRLTTDDCPPGSCTAADVIDQHIGGAFCNVTDGKCKIKTTLNTAAPGLIATDGQNAGIEILGCGLGGVGALDHPLRCGLLLK